MKNTMKKPVAIPVEKLRPFAGHPFKVKDDAEMNTLIESVQTQGMKQPRIIMIYPHRRARFPSLSAAPPQWWFPYLSSPLPGRSRRGDW